VQTEEFNKGHSFRVPYSSYSELCRVISKVPGVTFTRKQKFFWSDKDVGADFTFRGHEFQIETDNWDGAIWILTKDHAAHFSEMQELRDAVEKYPLSLFRRILF